MDMFYKKNRSHQLNKFQQHKHYIYHYLNYIHLYILYIVHFYCYKLHNLMDNQNILMLQQQPILILYMLHKPLFHQLNNIQQHIYYIFHLLNHIQHYTSNNYHFDNDTFYMLKHMIYMMIDLLMVDIYQLDILYKKMHLFLNSIPKHIFCMN